MKTAQDFARVFAGITKQFYAGELTLNGLWEQLEPKPPINEDVVAAVQRRERDKAAEICGCRKFADYCHVYRASSAIALLRKNKGEPLVVERDRSVDGPRLGNLCVASVDEHLQQEDRKYARTRRLQMMLLKTQDFPTDVSAEVNQCPSLYKMHRDSKVTPYHAVCWFMICDQWDRTDFIQNGLDRIANGYSGKFFPICDPPMNLSGMIGYAEVAPREGAIWLPVWEKRPVADEDVVGGEYGYDVVIPTRRQAAELLAEAEQAETAQEIIDMLEELESDDVIRHRTLQGRISSGKNIIVADDSVIAGYLDGKVVIYNVLAES